MTGSNNKLARLLGLPETTGQTSKCFTLVVQATLLVTLIVDLKI